MRRQANKLMILAVMMTIVVGACAKKQPPVARPMPPPAADPSAGGNTAPPAPPQPVSEPIPVPAMPEADMIAGKSLDDLNRDSPLKPAFFGLDSAELDAEGQTVVQSNAGLLKKYGSWVITIEGHCDERGTPEYNLALGERRAVAVKTYLVSLGISPDRLRTVSYGKEFPFDPGHSETAWSKNRRAHFVITAK